MTPIECLPYTSFDYACLGLFSIPFALMWAWIGYTVKAHRISSYERNLDQ